MCVKLNDNEFVPTETCDSVNISHDSAKSSLPCRGSQPDFNQPVVSTKCLPFSKAVSSFGV